VKGMDSPKPKPKPQPKPQPGGWFFKPPYSLVNLGFGGEREW